jgi:sorting nexin-29
LNRNVNTYEQSATKDYTEEVDENYLPTKNETEEAIGKLKNNQAPDIDRIQAELLNHESKELIGILQEFLGLIWTNENMPDEWKTGIICLLHKKGDPMQCANYRGISLLNTTYKIFSKIMYTQLLPYAEKVTGNYQCGFQHGKSTTDQIYTLRQILEKNGKFSIETHHLFIDFRTAYNSINRNQLYITMKEFNFPNKLIRSVKITMENSQCHIKLQSELSKPLNTINGLRQGDSLACLLFNIALEKVIRDSGIQTRGTIFYKSIQILAYADDTDIIRRSESDIKKAFLH